MTKSSSKKSSPGYIYGMWARDHAPRSRATPTRISRDLPWMRSPAPHVRYEHVYSYDGALETPFDVSDSYCRYQRSGVVAAARACADGQVGAMRLSFDDGSRRRNFSALRNVATPQYCR